MIADWYNGNREGNDKTMATESNNSDPIYAILTSRHASFSRAQIGDSAQLPSDDVDSRLRSLVGDGKAACLPDGSYLSDVSLMRLESSAKRTLGAFHRKNPFLRAMSSDPLKVVLVKAAEYSDFDAVMVLLENQKALVRDPDGRVRLPGHTVDMPEGWRAAADDMLAVYASAGLQPPSPYNFQANYPRHINVRAILGILVEQGKLVFIGDEIYIDAASMRRVKEALRELAKRSGGEITVGAVRDALSSTRKFVLPLLEYLNTEGFTRRDGDVHFLAS